MVLIGSYDTHLYALDAATGKLRWKLQTDGPVHATPAVVRRRRLHRRLRRGFRAVRVADGKELFKIAAGAYTGASPAGRRRPRLLRHVQQRGARASICKRDEDRRGATAIPDRAVPVLLVGGARRRPRDRRRPRQGGPRDRRGDRQGGLDVRDARARRLVAGRRRRPRLRRLERRQAVRARRGDRRRSSGSSTPATRSPPRPPSPPAASSSARRTAGSTVSGRAGIERCTKSHRQIRESVELRELVTDVRELPEPELEPMSEPPDGARRPDRGRQLFRRQLSAVLRLDAGGGRARRAAGARVAAGARRAARPLPAHSVLPEALPLLLLPRLHRQERAGGRATTSTCSRASGSCTRELPAIAGRPLELRLLRRRHAVVSVDAAARAARQRG